MPYAPLIQNLIDQNIVSAQRVAHLPPTTIQALSYPCLADDLARRGATLSADQFEAITAIPPQYVRRVIRDSTIKPLILDNLLTTAIIKKITTKELYEWLFQHGFNAVPYRNSSITPQFFEHISDPCFRTFVSLPGITSLMYRGLKIGDVEFTNLRQLRQQANFTESDIHSLSRKPEKLRWFINSKEQTNFFIRLIQNKSMSKEDFINANESTFITLHNVWIRHLIAKQQITFQQLLSIEPSYMLTYNETDPHKHLRIRHELVKAKLKEIIQPTVQDIDKYFQTYRGFHEFVTNIPEVRDAFMVTLLSSETLFNKLIRTQQAYDSLRALVSPQLPIPFAEITRETDLAEARTARPRFYQAVHICLAAFWLMKGRRAEESILNDLPLDILILIAAQAAGPMPGLDNTQRLCLADGAVAHLCQANANSLFGVPAPRATAAAPAAELNSNPPQPR